MAFEGGYTSAVNSAQTREVQQTEIERMLAGIAAQQWQQQQKEDELKKSKMLDALSGRALQLDQPPQPGGAPQGPPPQPMAPGQASQPMQMPQAPQPMQMGPGAAPPGQMAAPPQNAPGGMPPGGMAAAVTQMPQTQGWMPGKTAPPSLGGQPPAPPGGGTGGQLSPQPTSEQGDPILPPNLQTFEQAKETVQKMKDVPEELRFPLLEKLVSVQSQQNKEKLEKYRIDVESKKAGAIAEREKRLELEAAAGGKPTAAIKNAEYALGKGSPEAKDAVGKEVAKAGAPRAGESGVTSLGGYNGTYEDMTPRQKATVDWYATMQLGGDSTWRVGLSRIKGGSELIKAVDEHVPERAAELNLSPADIGTNKAIRVSTQAALTQNTKDLAMLKPYVNMLDQNTDILKKLAAKAIATDAALANRPINWLRTNASDNPDVAEYLAQVEIVKNEATRVISNPRLVGQMTDTARQEIDSVINGTMPLNATTRVLDRIQNDGHRRISTTETQQHELQAKLKEMFPTGKSASPTGTSQYVETRKTADGRTLGKKADGTIEEIK